MPGPAPAEVARRRTNARSGRARPFGAGLSASRVIDDCAHVDGVFQALIAVCGRERRRAPRALRSIVPGEGAHALHGGRRFLRATRQAAGRVARGAILPQEAGGEGVARAGRVDDPRDLDRRTGEAPLPAESEAPLRTQGHDEESPVAPGEPLQLVDDRVLARGEAEESESERRSSRPDG